jgi:hypothetical protein
MTQIGTTGLRWVGPYMREEFLTELQGAPACPSDEKPRESGRLAARGAAT